MLAREARKIAMLLIGMFEARCFRLQAAEGARGVGVTVGGSGKAGGGGLPRLHGQAACSVRSASGVDLCTNDTDGW